MGLLEDLGVLAEALDHGDYLCGCFDDITNGDFETFAVAHKALDRIEVEAAYYGKIASDALTGDSNEAEHDALADAREWLDS